MLVRKTLLRTESRPNWKQESTRSSMTKCSVYQLQGTSNVARIYSTGVEHLKCMHRRSNRATPQPRAVLSENVMLPWKSPPIVIVTYSYHANQNLCRYRQSNFEHSFKAQLLK